MATLPTAGNEQVLVVTPPQNQTIVPSQQAQATGPDTPPTIAVLSDNPVLKYALFGGLIYLAWKYLRRK